ncbi:spore coat protein CotJB [Clostridium luticellarii]|jgi:spore coat protein JB|uniref:CotJB protein n=1 Tax=Clostridium luticellarii TaxID=1691940 RepID=A0A2T0B816_9CLOT|nr:spore coat protein CotJB [Clostridium luticellarii]MCI1944268.1 spore coat protein CotJB [Clostridium luticellarii]MCI1967764.1 spore coat protein CotJB [Clostridium luticellarii]MCI1994642.1 spore coat protein CotJB [Clostridium luticellarii]MCI2038861.1 spore coat protein CotJB [Clostridium luticellarii]PRR79995.1 CotJB protein [Clostridium luticellarii]
MKDGKKLLDKIRQVEFAAVDLNIYLDNFPDNKKALADYNTLSKQLIYLKREYETNFGMLTNFGFSQSEYPWSWVNEPWPWEADK